MMFLAKVAFVVVAMILCLPYIFAVAYFWNAGAMHGKHSFITRVFPQKGQIQHDDKER